MEHSGDAVSAGTGAAAGTRGRAPWTVVAVAVVVLAAAAGAYAAGAAQAKTRTKTVVQKVTVTVPASPTTVAALKCVPGAAPGSCNTDEAEEIAIPDQPLDANTHAVLASQLVAARAAALRYPTVADAERAGMLLAGGFSPLTGAHFMDLKYSTGPFDPAHPGSYIYDGIDPSSKIIGLMYLGSDVNPPEGFAGPNDHWHRHSNTCVVFDGGGIKVPFPADSSVTKTQCDNVHGVFMRRTIWMVHAWVVPGYESPSGVFAHDNSDVRCADGSVKTDAAGFCSGT